MKQLIISHDPQKSWLRPTRYCLYRMYELEGVKVPVGFYTDGASVPRFFWWLFPPMGKYAGAAVVHDYLLFTKMDRQFADDTFYRAMITLGVAKWRAKSMWAAVRVFGFFRG